MKKNILMLSVCTALFLTSSSAFSALTVVGDLGGQSTAPFFDAINDQPDEFTSPESLSPNAPPASLSVASMLPVATPEMSPGAVTAHPLTLPGMPPIFLVGDDPLSRQWLQLRGSELRQLGATGLVVSVRDQAGLDSLKTLASGVDMVPVQGGDLARRLQISHYPLLITATGVSQ